MARRGFTLIETLLAVALTTVLVGTLTLLYGFAFQRIGRTATGFATTDQARRSLQTIADTAAQACSCATVSANGQTALKCVMPAVGVDSNGDGYCESYSPSSISKRGVERYAAGKRVWFYLSDATGAFGAAGTTLWRAQRDDDTAPTHSDADTSWTFLAADVERHPLVSGLAFAIDPDAHTATVTVITSSLAMAERKPGTTDAGTPASTVSLTRTVRWGSTRP